MFKSLLPQELYEVINSFCNINNLYEIRLRANMPILVNILGEYYELTNKKNMSKIVYSDTKLIDYIIK